MSRQRAKSSDFVPNPISSRHSSPDFKQELLVDHYITDLDAIVDSRRGGGNDRGESFKESLSQPLNGGGDDSSNGSSTRARGVSVDQLQGNIKTRSRYSKSGSFSWDPSELHEGFTDGSKSYSNPEKYAPDPHGEEEPGLMGKIIHIMTHPMILFLSFFLLDCKKHPRYFWLSFINSILWLGGLVFFIIQWVEKSGCLIGFSSALMGLTLGAAGTSAPDALVSFHVARNGLGDMAVSNALGECGLMG